MYKCTKCNKLVPCDCPDIEERLKKVAQMPLNVTTTCLDCKKPAALCKCKNPTHAVNIG
jgi:Fe2+ or Zn2+ uptake regulation protein